jgi:hypothetical protein
VLYGPKSCEPMKQKQAPQAFEEDPTEFITVDLEVYSRRKLSVLARALGQRLSLSYDGGEKGKYFCAFSGGGFFWPTRRRPVTADQQIVALVGLVRTLPPVII